jgi:hypothetical protein
MPMMAITTSNSTRVNAQRDISAGRMARSVGFPEAVELLRICHGRYEHGVLSVHEDGRVGNGEPVGRVDIEAGLKLVGRTAGRPAECNGLRDGQSGRVLGMTCWTNNS